MLDLDRLNEVALGNLTGRQVGSTTLDICEVVGNIELSECEVLVVVVPFAAEVNRVWAQLRAMLQTHNVDTARYISNIDRRMEAGGKTVHFMTYRQYQQGQHRGLTPSWDEPLFIDRDRCW